MEGFGVEPFPQNRDETGRAVNGASGETLRPIYVFVLLKMGPPVVPVFKFGSCPIFEATSYTPCITVWAVWNK